MDLVDEQLPEEFDAPEDQQIDPEGVGFALFLVNTAVPLAAIVLGGVEFGWDARDVRAGVAEITDHGEEEKEFDGFEFENPVANNN